jgi:hypothetical protein
MPGVALVYLRHRSSSSTTLDTSGQPRPSTGGEESAAQQPSGGAGNAAGNLPETLLTQTGSGTAPDALTQQVQAADTSSESSPTMIQSTAPSSTPANPTWPTNPFINPYATPTSGPGNTNAGSGSGSGSQGNPNSPVTQLYVPGGNVTGHGFVGD